MAWSRAGLLQPSAGRRGPRAQYYIFPSYKPNKPKKLQIRTSLEGTDARRVERCVLALLADGSVATFTLERAAGAYGAFATAGKLSKIVLLLR